MSMVKMITFKPRLSSSSGITISVIPVPWISPLQWFPVWWPLRSPIGISLPWLRVPVSAVASLFVAWRGWWWVVWVSFWTISLTTPKSKGIVDNLWPKLGFFNTKRMNTMRIVHGSRQQFFLSSTYFHRGIYRPCLRNNY